MTAVAQNLTAPPFPRAGWDRALNRADLPPRLKDLARLMASYAIHADAEGIFYVSREELRQGHVRDAGGRLGQYKLLDEKTIDRRVALVVAAGWVEVAQPGGFRDGKPCATEYRMAFPAGLEQGDSTKAVGGTEAGAAADRTVASLRTSNSMRSPLAAR